MSGVIYSLCMVVIILSLAITVLLLACLFIWLFRLVYQRTKHAAKVWWFIRNHYDEMQPLMSQIEQKRRDEEESKRREKIRRRRVGDVMKAKEDDLPLEEGEEW